MSCAPWSDEKERADFYKLESERYYKHLREYEESGLTPQKVKDLQMKVVDLELKLQGHNSDLFDQRESVIDEIRDFLKECGFIEASMAVEENREQ